VPNPSPSEPTPPPDRQIWIDGRFVSWTDASVHVMSHSLQRGSLVFDYLSLHETPCGVAAFRMPEHVARLLHSCELMGLPIEQSQGELEAAILETARANPGAKSVKISAYFASVEVDVVPLDTHVTVAIAAYDPWRDILKRLPTPPPPKPEHLRLWVEKKQHHRREDIVSPQAKVSANYASPMMAKARARAAGYDEIVLVDEGGFLAEGPTTNLFIVDRSGTVRTPPEEKVLHGVTRSSIIEIAKAEGIPLLEVPVRPEELTEAGEAFLTATSAGVWPIESVDGRSLGEACPGPRAKSLRARFERVIAGEDPEFAHWLTPLADSR